MEMDSALHVTHVGIQTPHAQGDGVYICLDKAPSASFTLTWVAHLGWITSPLQHQQAAPAEREDRSGLHGGCVPRGRARHHHPLLRAHQHSVRVCRLGETRQRGHHKGSKVRRKGHLAVCCLYQRIHLLAFAVSAIDRLQSFVFACVSSAFGCQRMLLFFVVSTMSARISTVLQACSSRPVSGIR